MLADGTVVPLSERVVLGRHPDCDVVLHDPQVSRRHAEVRLVSGRHMLLDLSSSNGTWIDEQADPAAAPEPRGRLPTGR